MKRIMIIGSPGTGKSVFARKLATKTGVPLIHLDYYYHDKNKNYYNDKKAWEAQLEKLSSQESWIIDGNYGATMAKRLNQADTIFYFDLPRRLAIWGALKRRISALHTKRADMPEEWSEKINLEFYKYIWNFNKKYKYSTQELLAQNSNKSIITFTNHQQTDEFLNDLKILK